MMTLKILGIAFLVGAKAVTYVGEAPTTINVNHCSGGTNAKSFLEREALMDLACARKYTQYPKVVAATMAEVVERNISQLPLRAAGAYLTFKCGDLAPSKCSDVPWAASNSAWQRPYARHTTCGDIPCLTASSQKGFPTTYPQGSEWMKCYFADDNTACVRCPREADLVEFNTGGGRKCACPEGSFMETYSAPFNNAESRCVCPQGAFVQKEEGELVTIAAPTTTTSAAGAATGTWLCVPKLVHFMSQIQTPILTIRKISSSAFELRVKTQQPLPHYLYEGGSLKLVADISTVRNSVQFGSACAVQWTRRSSSELRINLTYADLDGPCMFNTSLSDQIIHRHTVVHAAIFYSFFEGKSLVDFAYPLEIQYARNGSAAYGPLVAWGQVVAKKQVETAYFRSGLTLYRDNRFTVKVRDGTGVFRVGELIYVSHTFFNTTFKVDLMDVWLSPSSDPSVVQANLTSGAILLSSPAGSVHFSVAAVECRKCYMHVKSKARPSTQRRLTAQEVQLKNFEEVQLSQDTAQDAARESEDITEVRIMPKSTWVDDSSTTTQPPSTTIQPLSTTAQPSTTQHSVSSKLELKVDLDILTAAEKAKVQAAITNVTLYSMELDATERAELAKHATTTLSKKAGRRLAAAGNAMTVATTKVVVASAAAATAAISKITSAGTSIKGNLLTAIKSIPGIADAVPGGLAALTISVPAAESKSLDVLAPSTTLAKEEPGFSASSANPVILQTTLIAILGFTTVFASL